MDIARIQTLPIPEFCDNCASPNVKFVTNVVYSPHHVSLGAWPWIYFCRDCTASVGCHANTCIPLGRMADNETRRLRVECHSKFDPIWKTKIMTRTQAYVWLSAELGIAQDDCHISWLSKDQLKIAIRLAETYYDERSRIATRRNVRRSKRITERLDREFTHKSRRHTEDRSTRYKRK